MANGDFPSVLKSVSLLNCFNFVVRVAELVAARGHVFVAYFVDHNFERSSRQRRYDPSILDLISRRRS